MEATDMNIETANKIIAIIADSNRTIEDADDILHYVSQTIRRTSTVKMPTS